MDRDEALKVVQRAEDTFNRGDVDAILSRYTEDVVIRFAGIPEISGKIAAEKFLRARFARQNARTGKAMLGHGAEFWRYRDGKLAYWEAALNVWEAGADASAAFL